jgi:hypothetical protein
MKRRAFYCLLASSLKLRVHESDDGSNGRQPLESATFTPADPGILPQPILHGGTGKLVVTDYGQTSPQRIFADGNGTSRIRFSRPD